MSAATATHERCYYVTTAQWNAMRESSRVVIDDAHYFREGDRTLTPVRIVEYLPAVVPPRHYDAWPLDPRD